MRWIGTLVWSVGGTLMVAGACTGRGAPTTLNPTSGAGTGGSNLSAIASSGTSTGGGENRIDDLAAPCDNNVQLDSNDPFDAARALGICTVVNSDDEWGVVDARWTMADGSPAIPHPNFDIGHGMLGGFGGGALPQEGSRFLVLSSGTARQPGQSGYMDVGGYDKGYISASPAGFPQESPACPGVTTGATQDDIGLELVLRPPPTAESLAFDFNFFTYEWPDWVCSEFNDFFLAFMEPPPPGHLEGNISFDSEGNVVSVNNALVRVCDCLGPTPCGAPAATPMVFYDCEEGSGELNGTGFEDHAATSWLVTRAPVDPTQDFRLRWTIYDSGDGFLDSTVVLDNFRWLGDPESEPITDPK